MGKNFGKFAILASTALMFAGSSVPQVVYAAEAHTQVAKSKKVAKTTKKTTKAKKATKIKRVSQSKTVAIPSAMSIANSSNKTSSMASVDSTSNWRDAYNKIEVLYGDQLQQAKTQLKDSLQKEISILDDTRKTPVTTTQVKSAMQKMSVSQFRTEFNNQKQTVLSSLNNSSLNDEDKATAVNKLTNFAQDLNNMTQTDYNNYVSSMNQTDLQKITDSMNDAIKQAPTQKSEAQSLLQKVKTANDTEFKQILLQQAKKAEQLAENPNKDQNTTATSTSSKDTLASTIAGVAAGGLLSPAINYAGWVTIQVVILAMAAPILAGIFGALGLIPLIGPIVLIFGGFLFSILIPTIAIFVPIFDVLLATITGVFTAPINALIGGLIVPKLENKMKQAQLLKKLGLIVRIRSLLKLIS
ncbi:hypothetical protein [Lentilactobacillus kosonis]|uniref:Uncharacterized protein n=1 Tax=Lentilactobacillus kosonis TaxID=2810561 RepID=A0A401FK69_9LACO|nr:hypothetical protein [Lentilactobacillus kosonis]GAY72790.1 hypothetical protein NBRC111893_936 [Lentilactobacillus kosonis]